MAKCRSKGERLQRLGELFVLDLFITLANSAGIHLPGDCIAALRAIDNMGELILLHDLPGHVPKKIIPKAVQRAIASHWPPQELLAVSALAQHYGLPTRLLDFTWNPFVAAYFAALSALNTESKEFAVWAMDVDRRRDAIGPLKDKGELRILTVPASVDHRLVAQQGLFVVWQANPQPLADITKAPIDVVLINQVFDDNAPSHYPKPLHKIVCPTKEAPKVLRLLHGIGIGASTILGGFVGAAVGCREIERWDVPVVPKALFM
jgi:hypothetical protein